MAEATIPIFMLNIVPLPGEPVPLHIFEARYKRMIADCLADKYGQPMFGISYLQVKDKKLHEVGCTVLIEEIIEEYDDGRLDIVTLGEKRYHLLKTFEDQAYPTARVAFFEDDDPHEVTNTQLLDKINRYLERFISLIGKTFSLRLDDFDNSFQIAYLLNLEKEHKLTLLEMRHENQRLQFLIDYLEEFVPRLEQAKDFRQRIRSNGHF